MAAPSMAHDVFISYSSKDKPIADAICATVEQNGVRCFIAPRDIQPGADWGESIIHGIAGSRVFVLVLSHFANTSQQIKREVERAVNRGLPIIPYRIEDVMPAESLEYFLSTPHWLDAFTPPVERHAQYLADTVKAILAAPAGGPVTVPPPSPLAAPEPAARPPWLQAVLKPLPLAAIAGSLLVLAGLTAYALRPTTFVGKWKSINVSWSAGASSVFNGISLGEIFSQIVFGGGATSNFSVGAADQYQGGLTGTDRGVASRTSSGDLVLASSSHVTSRVHVMTIPAGDAAVAAEGGQSGDSVLILTGDNRAQEPWVGQPDTTAAGGPFSDVAGHWRNGAWVLLPSGQTWTGDLTITGNGAYTLTLTEVEGGLWTVANGNWTKTLNTALSPSGAVTSGPYQFHGHDEVTTTSTAGSITWKRSN
jgi:hypothetical protein